jgi:hypothetical protein
MGDVMLFRHGQSFGLHLLQPHELKAERAFKDVDKP